jgi:hypothetical protein
MNVEEEVGRLREEIKRLGNLQSDGSYKVIISIFIQICLVFSSCHNCLLLCACGSVLSWLSSSKSCINLWICLIYMFRWLSFDYVNYMSTWVCLDCNKPEKKKIASLEKRINSIILFACIKVRKIMQREHRSSGYVYLIIDDLKI